MASGSEAEVLIVVDNLKEFVGKKVNLISQRHTDQVRNLCEGLQKLRNLIKEKRGNLENLVINSIRELVHEAEEAIEFCVVQELKRKTVSNLPQIRSIRGFKEEYQEMDKRLQDVRGKVDQLFKNFERLELLKFSKKNDQRWNDKALLPGDDKHIVSCEDEVQTVIDLLKTDSGGNLEVISITGMVGLGKTTLARRVFNDKTVESLFSLRAFLSVSQDYNKNKVFLEILKQFHGKEQISGKEKTELVEMLRDSLNNSSFLIILDDVRSQEVLNDIRSLLVAAQPQQQGNQGNHQHQRRVLLITARGRKSAVGMGCKNHHDLRQLNPKESQELLRMETFGKNECPIELEECPRELEECEKKILEKCYGLPLAIVSFARILAKRRKKIEWWKTVAQYVNVFTEESLISTAIRAIFDGLNDNLKLCFLYLGVFKRDLEIPVWILLRLWMAEGLVREVGDRGISRFRCGICNNIYLEDVAEDYLEELVERNVVMVAKRRSNGKIKAIKMHGGLLDFCISEARKENLFNESFSSETCRRLCIRNLLVSQFHKSVPTKATTATNPLRSILYFSDNEMIPSSNDIRKPILKVLVNNVIRPFKTAPSRLQADKLFSLFLSSLPRTFKLVRVLDVSSFVLTELPAELFSLFLLRYIAISCNSSFLPKELSNLCNLQTLIIETSSETLEIRADVRDMELLMHIHSNKSTLLRKVKEKTNSINHNLQTISSISPESCTKELFDKTPNLKKLGISGKLQAFVEGNGNKHNFLDHVAELNHLQNLKLLNDNLSSKYALPLKSHSFPGSLTNLTLMNTCLDEENMSRIGTMENLEILKLQSSEFKEALWESKDEGFKMLKVLKINVTNLKQWKASGNHFPRLTSLFLWLCDNLETLPVGLPEMQSLKTVNLRFGHSNLASSLKGVLSQKLKSEPGFKLLTFPDYL